MTYKYVIIITNQQKTHEQLLDYILMENNESLFIMTYNNIYFENSDK